MKYRRITLGKAEKSANHKGTGWRSSCCGTIMTYLNTVWAVADVMPVTSTVDYCTCDACGQGWAVVYPKET